MKRPTPIFTGTVKAGKMKILGVNKLAMERYILSLPDGPYDITIKKHRKDRTTDQNAYYWGVVVKILGQHFGYDAVDMHTELKRLFNPIVSKIDGAIIGGSTTALSTVEFYHDQDSYIERICRWAASDHGVYIPPPERISD